MNFNKFEQFEMTNIQTEKTIGGTQGDFVSCPTSALMVNNLANWAIPNANLIPTPTVSPQQSVKPNLTMP